MMPISKSPVRKAAYDEAMEAARAAWREGDFDHCFRLLERAHILGQPWAIPHTLSHWMMLQVGWRRGDSREVRGQVLRLAASGLLSLVGWLPEGNTGGADISPTKVLPLDPELAAICRNA